jgi:hypothetical protein
VNQLIQRLNELVRRLGGWFSERSDEIDDCGDQRVDHEEGEHDEQQEDDHCQVDDDVRGPGLIALVEQA